MLLSSNTEISTNIIIIEYYYMSFMIVFCHIKRQKYKRLRHWLAIRSQQIILALSPDLIFALIGTRVL